MVFLFFPFSWCFFFWLQVQSVMYRALAFYGVYLEGTLLKPNMVNPGKSYKGPKT